MFVNGQCSDSVRAISGSGADSEMPSIRVVFCDRGLTMDRLRNIEELFAGRHFDREVILLCVRWYLRYKLSFRDLVEMMPNEASSLPIRRSCAGFDGIRQISSSGGIALAAALAARGESMKPISRCAESGPICIGQ